MTEINNGYYEPAGPLAARHSRDPKPYTHWRARYALGQDKQKLAYYNFFLLPVLRFLLL